MWFILLYGLLFLFFGLIVTEGNATTLVAGLNTASKEDLKQLDVPHLVSRFKKFFYFLGITCIIIGIVLWKFVDKDIALITVTLYSLVAILVFMIRNKEYSRSNSKIGVYIMVATILFVVGLFYLGLKEDKMILSQNTIEIEGTYGDDILYNEIESVAFDSLPKLTLKINGFGMHNVKKGYFKRAGGKKVLLILNSREAPIHITLKNGKEIYYSSRSDVDNVLFFKELKKKIESQ